MLKKMLPFLGIVLFAYILYKIGIANLYNAISGANIFYLAFALLLTFSYTVLQTWKWNLILKRQSMHVKFYDLFVMQVKSVFYGLVTPGRFGGFMKVFYLKDKMNINFGTAMSSVLIDRILDTMSIFILAFIGGLFLVNKILNLSYVIFFGFVFILLVAYGVSDKKITKKVLGFFYNRFLPERFKQSVKESFYSFYDNLPRKKDLVIPFLANIISWVWTYTIAYAVALSLGIEINYFALITIYAITTVISIVPITISGLGTREASLVVFLGFFGVAAESVVAMSLVAFFIGGVVPAIIGFGYIVQDGNLYKARQEG